MATYDDFLAGPIPAGLFDDYVRASWNRYNALTDQYRYQSQLAAQQPTFADQFVRGLGSVANDWYKDMRGTRLAEEAQARQWEQYQQQQQLQDELTRGRFRNELSTRQEFALSDRTNEGNAFQQYLSQLQNQEQLSPELLAMLGTDPQAGGIAWQMLPPSARQTAFDPSIAASREALTRSREASTEYRGLQSENLRQEIGFSADEHRSLIEKRAAEVTRLQQAGYLDDAKRALLEIRTSVIEYLRYNAPNMPPEQAAEYRRIAQMPMAPQTPEMAGEMAYQSQAGRQQALQDYPSPTRPSTSRVGAQPTEGARVFQQFVDQVRRDVLAGTFTAPTENDVMTEANRRWMEFKSTQRSNPLLELMEWMERQRQSRTPGAAPGTPSGTGQNPYFTPRR